MCGSGVSICTFVLVKASRLWRLLREERVLQALLREERVLQALLREERVLQALLREERVLQAREREHLDAVVAAVRRGGVDAGEHLHTSAYVSIQHASASSAYVSIRQQAVRGGVDTGEHLC